MILGLAAIATLPILFAAPSTVAAGKTRTISFHHIHTKETLTILYKKDGRYIPDAMKKIDWVMRDWREDEAIKIDPKAIDLLWEMHTELGSREPIHIICGYRSRKTNNMLRRTRGGQARRSKHITGQAIDVAFPDIPARQLRYSALIRERGGVGYYPTSAIPFVHVDTGRVRHWPKIGRTELALLFPSGRSKHRPKGGRALSPWDVRAARVKGGKLAQKVAQYFDIRNKPKLPVMVADARVPAPPAPKPVVRPQLAPASRMSVGAPPAPPKRLAAATAPRLKSKPRLVERSSRFTPTPSNADRERLNGLVSLASLDPATATPRAPRTTRPKAAKPILATASLGLSLPARPKLTTKEPDPIAKSATSKDATAAQTGFSKPMTDSLRLGWRSAWTAAASYDDDHPEELAYRPFALGPILAATTPAANPAFMDLVPPDIAETLAVLDDEGTIQPMRLTPGWQAAKLAWAQEFRGDAVNVAALPNSRPAAAPNRILAEKLVRTSQR
jgi:uncharacterized protein YcbK (DUF882 family)